MGLVRHLLSITHEYVLLGIFTTDYLEKMFGKLREGSGGTYFINVQQVLEKLSIHKTKLLLTLDINVSSLNYLSVHSCANCTFLMGDNAIDVFDNLPKLEMSLPLMLRKHWCILLVMLYTRIYQLKTHYITSINLATLLRK